MPFSVELIKKLERVEPELREVLIALLEEVERQREESVTKREFLEFARQTEENFQKVWEAIKALTEAQKRTEEELKAFRKSTEDEFQKVWQSIKELAEAQRRTEQRVEELAEAQRRTEQRVEELAEAQKRTEGELKELALALRETRRHVGDLTDTVGYTLENAAYKALPELLRKDYGIQIKGRLKRGYLKDKKGKYIEVNIIGDALLKGRPVKIVGESKTRLSIKGVDDFIKKKLNRLDGIYGEFFPVMVTHMISEPEVEEYARQKGIALYFSYDF